MVNLSTMRAIIGFGFKGLGFFWTLSDKILCNDICKNGCSVSQSNQCSFLFLFIGILFIIMGYALIVMKDKQKIKLTKKIKKNIKLIRNKI